MHSELIEVIAQDDELIIINKPSGLLSVPGRQIHESAVSQLVSQFGEIHVIHRLDRDTSGLLVFARNKTALTYLQQQFEKQRTHKIYEAVIEGHLKQSNGIINMPLLVDWPNRPKQQVNNSEGRYALTRWQVRCHEYRNHRAVTRIDLLPKTGRSHQLRVHCQQLGHPIIGDSLYNDQSCDSRLHLHSRELGFFHPKTEQWCHHFVQPPF